MPELAGHQVYQTLVQSRPDLRVLYMSGYTENDILRRGLVQRDTAFLQKPFTAASLARAVRSVLDGREVVSEQLA
jgi:DNA-binding NarL/FixJ family response regulator